MNEGRRRRPDRGGGESPRDRIDTALRLLSDPLPRSILLQFAERSRNEMSVDDLVDRCVARHGGADRESVAVQCHHSHLPALEAAGVVDFDRRAGDVRYYPDPFVEEVLDVVERWRD